MTESDSVIATGKVVHFRYTLTAADGKILDRSGDEPLPYLHGEENIVPGLEAQLEGKKSGDKLRAVVAPEDAYGERMDSAEQRVPREAFPPEAEITVGEQYAATGPDGENVPFWVKAIENGEIVIDLNHPLAGETLTFDVEIISVRDASEEELAHGHVHGEGGHHHH